MSGPASSPGGRTVWSYIPSKGEGAVLLRALVIVQAELARLSTVKVDKEVSH